MSSQEFNVGVIKPIECMKEGWELIKDQYWLFFGMTVGGLIIASFIPFGILIGPLFCGIYYALMKKMDGGQPEFGDLFKGFNHFVPSLIVTLFLIIPSFIFFIVAYIPLIVIQVSARGKEPDPEIMIPFFIGFMVAMLIFGIVMACIHLLIFFAYPLIVERNMSGMEAFKLSARAARKNIGGLVGYILCQFALAMAGYLALCIGVYLTIPIMYAGAIVVYRKVFPKPGGSQFNPPPPPTAFEGAGTRY